LAACFCTTNSGAAVIVLGSPGAGSAVIVKSRLARRSSAQPLRPPAGASFQNRAGAVALTTVGLRPPFVTATAPLSHPDCRGIPILIVARHGAKYERAVTCLVKDRDALLTFYDFPAEHWDHLRTANPIESVFATVRHRTVRTRGALSQDTARLMVFKLIMAAAKTWRRLKGENQ